MNAMELFPCAGGMAEGFRAPVFTAMEGRR